RHQVALILDGDEAAGDAGEAKARQPEQANVDQEHNDAEAEAPAHGLAVNVRRPLEDPVEGAEENIQYPVHRTDQEPAQRPSRERAWKEQDERDSPRQQGGAETARRRLLEG